METSVNAVMLLLPNVKVDVPAYYYYVVWVIHRQQKHLNQ